MNMNDDLTSSHAKGVRPAGQLGGLLAKGGKLVQEDDEGAVEYKWRLTSIAPTRFEHLVTQMKFRVAEGRGQCMYELGVDDDGHPRGLTDPDYVESLATLRRMADRLGYFLSVIHERKVPCDAEDAQEGDVLTCAELHVSKSNTNETQDLRIAMCGAVDAGKSTLVSVLAHGTLDDGCGSVRQLVFNHKHELNTGRTSSVSEQVVGFDSAGKITNYDGNTSLPGDIDDGGASTNNFYANTSSTAHCMTETIAERSVKLVTLMDLAGAEKYSKTTLSGITTKTPGYACVVGSFTQGRDPMVKQLEMCTSLRTRFFIVINKADRVSPAQRNAFLENLSAPLEALGFQPKLVTSTHDAHRYAVGLKANLIQHPATRTPPPTDSQDAEVPPSTQIVPVFFVSCVRGDGCEFLKWFLHQLPPAVDDPQSLQTLPPEILVDQCFDVPNVGHIFAGFVKQGVVELGTKLSMGPDRRGNFSDVTVASIHMGGGTVRKVTPGLEASFFFLETPPRSLDTNRKGINIIDRHRSSVTVCMEFDAEVTVQNLVGLPGVTTKVLPGQEPVCYCRNIRQAVKIISIDRGSLEKGQFGIVKCRFLFHPEVLDVDGVVVLATTHARLIGTTTSCSPISPATANLVSPQMFPCQEFEIVPAMSEVDIIPVEEDDVKAEDGGRQDPRPLPLGLLAADSVELDCTTPPESGQQRAEDADIQLPTGGDGGAFPGRRQRKSKDKKKGGDLPSLRNGEGGAAKKKKEKPLPDEDCLWAD